MSAWSGGIADEGRNRMIVWGGGHNDYYGNEIYALDLNALTMARLNDPSPINPTPDVCVTALPDGAPNSRHSYSGLTYIANADAMFVIGGAPAEKPGCLTNDVWTLNLATLAWTSRDPHVGPTPHAGVGLTAYDPVTGKVFGHDDWDLYSYDFTSNTFTNHNDNTSIDYHLNGVVDPDHRLFVAAGGGQLRVFDISGNDPNYSMQTLDSASGCSALASGNYPGMAWDSKRKQVVGWAGGDDLIVFDSVAKTCSTQTFAGGPGPAQQDGTNGRFRYFPQLDVFAVVNSVDDDAFTLRLP